MPPRCLTPGRSTYPSGKSVRITRVPPLRRPSIRFEATTCCVSPFFRRASRQLSEDLAREVPISPHSWRRGDEDTPLQTRPRRKGNLCSSANFYLFNFCFENGPHPNEVSVVVLHDLSLMGLAGADCFPECISPASSWVIRILPVQTHCDTY